MGRAIAVLVALAALTLVGSHHIPGHVQRHQPPPQAPSFQRAAVESRPAGAVLGLPIRTAVESVPEHYQGHRQPLRDAVEASLKR